MRMLKQGFYGQIPAQPHDLSERITPVEKCIVLCHIGVPDVAEHEWTLDIDGLVERPLTLNMAMLRALPKATLESVHQCAGSPLDPRRPTQRVCNVRWAGARLSDLLERCGVKAGAAFLWSRGLDEGAFADVECGAYLKDLPLDRVGQDVLIAYEINGLPLRPEQGYPARLMVPGFYGTNSVKWLSRLTLAATRAIGPFTTRWYNDVIDQPAGWPAVTKPVWALAPQSVIVAPSGQQTVAAGLPLSIWGWAWSDAEIAEVRVSCDAGGSWIAANLEPRHQRAWQRFEIVHPGLPRGVHRLLSIAISSTQEAQPLTGARNAALEVSVVAN